MVEEKWFQELKVGDKFYTEEFGRYRIYTIKKFTNTEIVTEPFNNSTTESTRFNRKTGRSLGGGAWHTEFARPLTLEIREKLRRLNKLNIIGSYTSWKDLSDEDLILVYNIVKKYRKE